MHLLVNEILRHFNRLTPIVLHHLSFEVLVLQLQKLNLFPKVYYDWLLSIDLNNRLVFDIHSSCGVIQSRNSLISVHLRRRNTCNHESLGSSSKRVLQKHCELRVSKWNVLLIDNHSIVFLGEHANNLAKCEQWLIDVTCLLGHGSFRLRFLKSLGTS